MSVQEIERAVRQLSSDELAAFRAWFAEFDAALWDQEIEQDIAAGRLDALADEALRDLREGRCIDPCSAASNTFLATHVHLPPI